jgi:hypothetical protein
MKKIFFIYMITLLVLNAAALFAAAPVTGKVLEESSQIVLLETDGPGNFPAGSEIELTYTAGFMEMLIGRFKVAGVSGNRYTLEVVNLNTRPSPGMKVNIVPAVNWQSQLFNSQSPSASSNQPSAAATESKIEGEVTGVYGEDVVIEVKGDSVPGVEDIAELKYVTGSGMEIEVGTWKVKDIKGRQVTAVPAKKLTQPREGLKVTFKPKPTNEPVLAPGGAALPELAVPGAGLPAQGSYGAPSSEDTITLLGVSAPSAVAGAPGTVTDNNLFSPTYGQPITPEAQKQQEEYMRQISIQQKKEILKQRQRQGIT